MKQTTTETVKRVELLACGETVREPRVLSGVIQGVGSDVSAEVENTRFCGLPTGCGGVNSSGMGTTRSSVALKIEIGHRLRTGQSNWFWVGCSLPHSKLERTEIRGTLAPPLPKLGFVRPARRWPRPPDR